jgi:hypothetical protein
VNKKTLQASKAMMVQRLMAKKFNALAGVEPLNPMAMPKPQKPVHAHFRLINCLFSNELSAQADFVDNVDRSALDSGAVGDNRIFWQLRVEQFNSRFPVNSVDGPMFADTLHFSHPTIDNHHEHVQPSNRNVSSSSDLVVLWKGIKREYEIVFNNFKMSGNHNSSFTMEAMSCQSMTSADLNDVFGVEAGGFCNFTNSIVIIYLRLWLNEKPGHTNFVSRRLPEAIQIDTMVPQSSAIAVKPAPEAKMRKSPDILADSINNLAKARKIDDGRKEMHSCITKFHESETRKSAITAQMEEIQLVQMQIEVLAEWYENCNESERKARYKKGLDDLEDKLDVLLMS